MVEIRNLHKSFGGQHVLRGVNLQIAQGEIVVVIGRSGEGKSVLLKHLMGLLKPDEGEILVDGVDITRLHGRGLDRIRERFGVVFQGGALFDSLTAFENVAFPLREKTRLPEETIREKCLTRLKEVGLTDIGHKYPAEVSGGMKKRVALARALTMDPEILLFDEPTTGLDPIMVNAIHRLILDLHRHIGFTAILVSHEIPEIFGIADRVAMLHKGVVIEEGTPEAIQFSTNPVVRQFISGDPEGPIQPD